MNELIKIEAPAGVTMSSREIAELTGKRHDNVMRTCRDLKACGVTPQIEESEFNHNGNDYKEYRLNKRDSLVLVARLSPEFTGKVIDRWLELEQVTPAGLIPDFTDPAASARAWADQYDARKAIEARLEATKPAVEFVERYVEARTSQCISDVAKIIGWNPQAFFKQLDMDGVIFKRGVWLPHQEQIDKGRFEVKTGENDGFGFRQTRVTPKGITWLAEKYGKDAIPEVSASVLKKSKSTGVLKH
jgi:phage antirepressor YoqD-like protein